MSNPEKKQPPKRTPLTLETVTRMAREVAFKYHHHQPTLIIEGHKQTIITQVTPLENTYERRAQQMFTIGFTLAASDEVGVLVQAFFISEAWMSLSPDGNWPDLPPSKDPKRTEVLLIAQVNVPTHQNGAVILEMIRNTEEHLTELKAFPSDDGVERQVESPLLNAFVQGFLQGMNGTIKPN